MRIDGVLTGQTVNLSNLSDVLSKLNAGDMVRAQILEITSNELLLRLFDGTTFTASSTSPLDVKKGEFVDFSVKNKNENQVILEKVKKPDSSNENNLNEIKKQLLSLNIKPDAKSIEIAQKIKSFDLPLNKEVFDKVMGSIIKLKELTPEKSVLLTANNIEINQKSISNLNQLLNDKFKLGNKLDELFKLLSDIPEVTQELTSEQGIEQSLISPKESTLSGSVNKQAVEPGSYPDNKQSIIVNNEALKNVLDSIIKAGKVDENSQTKPITEKIINFLKGELDLPENKNLKALFENNNLLDKLNILFKEENLIKSQDILKNISNGFIKADNETRIDIQPKEFAAIDDFLKKVFLKFKENADIDITNSADKTGLTGDKTKNSLQNAMEKLFIKVNSENLKDELNPKNLYKEIYSKLENIKEIVDASNIQNKGELLGKIDNIQNQIKFINDINNFTSYIQIPINMPNKNSTGELFILKNNKGRKKLDPQNLTVLLSLDTENIGQIDTLISINKKNISLNIRAQKQDVIGFIKENCQELYDSLNDKGYKLVDTKYRLIEEEVNVLNFNEFAKKELEGNRLPFDFKI